MPNSLETRNSNLEKMQALVEKAKTEKRSLSSAESTQFEKLKAEVETIDKSLTNEEKLELRSVKRAGKQPSALEVRGYTKEERIGSNALDVTVGDLIYSHITGKFRNEEVRASLSTTSGGLAIPVEVYKDFIDMLRSQSFLGETTIYPMTSKSLLVPKVTGDIAPYFKLENEPIIESDPLFESVTLTARPLYAMTSISLELIESSNLDVGQVITTIMANAMRSAMQTFLISGATNGYTGIVNDADINRITGATAIDYASIGAGVRAVREANGEPNGLVLTSGALTDLELRTDTTGQFITPPQFYQNLNKFTVTDVADTQALVGDFSSLAWGVLSSGGLQIEIDRYGTAFQNGQIKVRARINGDFALTNPSLMSLITTV